jgi:CheY-like chemotaxis protein
LKSPISANNLSSIQKRNFKDVSTNCLKELSPFLTQDIKYISKDNQIVTKNNLKGNLLTLIHQKYSNIEKLKNRGVEILTENENEIEKKNKDNNSCCLSSMNSNKDNKSLKDKKSISVEIDSDDYIEFENDNDSLDFENDLKIHKNEENDNNCNKNNNHLRNNSFLLNLNCINTSGLYSSPKNNRINISNLEENKPSNKTFNYNKVNNDRLYVIPEINENGLKDLTNLEIPKISKNNSPISLMKCDCDCKDILVVDDDEFICKTSKNILKSFKLEADFASDGQECINKIKEKQKKNCNCPKNKYKLVLMDITMPVMDGIEAAKNIQKMIDENKLYNTIKVIFISAHVNLDLSSIMNGIKCAIDYYAKPISGVKYKALLDKYYYSK